MDSFVTRPPARSARRRTTLTIGETSATAARGSTPQSPPRWMYRGVAPLKIGCVGHHNHSSPFLSVTAQPHLQLR